MNTLHTKNKNVGFSEKHLLWQMIRFSFPLIATGIIQLLFNTADSIVVGRWGGNTADECETALAAVGSCTALINLLINFALGLSVGTGVCAAKAIGAKRSDILEQIAQTSVLLACIVGLIVGGIGIIFAKTLLILMGTDPAVLDQAVPYMIAYFFGTPANMIYNFSAAILRSNGDTNRPFVYLTVAGVANFIFNIFMVLLCKLGAPGVGIATAASQWIACFLIVGYLFGKKSFCRFSFRKLKFHSAELKEILSIGIPSGLQSTIFSLSNILIQSSVNSFGKVATAANAAASSIGDYIYTAEYSFFHTSLTFVSQNVGAKKFKCARKCMLLCILCVFVIGFSSGITCVILGEYLLSLFLPNNPVAIQMGMTRLKIMLPLYFLCGIMDVGNGVLRGMGKSLTAMLISVIGVCGTRIIWIFTIFRMFRSLEILYISFPIAWGATAVINIALSLLYLKRSVISDQQKTAENF